MNYFITGLILGILSVYSSYAISSYVWGYEVLDATSSTDGSLGRGIIIVIAVAVATWVISMLVEKLDKKLATKN